MGEFHDGILLAAGVLIGLASSVALVRPIYKLAARMGLAVAQGERLAAHVSREYAPLKERLERLEREVASLRKAISEGG